MKKRDWILAAVIAAAAFLVWGINTITQDEGEWLQIMKDGEVFGTYSLSENQEIDIEGTNSCRIRDGEVSMIDADCPDQICVHTVSISQSGRTIVCLPNKVVLEIISEGNDEDTEDGVDSISS
ncbi:MAG: NusG domain II-containing protein [Clostridia bacterium]|nr:NusG domain II-containing protein [Clostridia bacterium]NCC43759.1 NusG domain II-containing protein [Clostridia bacterium]